MIDSNRCYSAIGAWKACPGLPRQLLFDALESGQIRAVRRGRRWLVPGSAVVEFLDRLGKEVVAVNEMPDEGTADLGPEGT